MASPQAIRILMCKQHKKGLDDGPSVQCSNPAIYRYTWPGADESTICEDCAANLRVIAGALGLYIQLIPLFSLKE